MATSINKSGLDNMLKAILSAGNSEQNMAYPPYVYESQFNVVTSLLIDALVKTYPNNIDMLRPFIKVKKKSVKSGYVELEEDHRNILSAGISAKEDGTGECEDGIIIDTEREFELSKMKAGCRMRPIEFVSDKVWDYRTTSQYKYPTYWNPIGCFFDSDKFKVCPYDLSSVELRYVRKENVYRYGYKMNPDDTFVFDSSTSIDSEWNNAAFSKLFPALLSLYGAYTRDPSTTDWARILHNEGIL